MGWLGLHPACRPHPLGSHDSIPFKYTTCGPDGARDGLWPGMGSGVKWYE